MVAATRGQHVEAIGAWLYQREIEDFLKRGDADVGLRSAFGAQLAAAEGLSGAHVSYDFDESIVRLVDSGVLGAHRVVRATFQKMQANDLGLELRVLNQLFGHVTPADDLLGFGPLANIVHLTEIAEEARVGLVLQRAKYAIAKLDLVYPTQGRRARIERDIEAARKRLAQHENRAHRLEDAAEVEAEAWRLVQSTGPGAGFWRAVRAWLWAHAQLESVRGWWTEETSKEDLAKADREERAIRKLFEELDREPLARAKVGACYAEDLATTAREALRYWVAYHGPQRPTGKDSDPAVVHWMTTHRRPWECERNAFIFFVAQEAERLRARAFGAYAVCRREVTR